MSWYVVDLASDCVILYTAGGRFGALALIAGLFWPGAPVISAMLWARAHGRRFCTGLPPRTLLPAAALPSSSPGQQQALLRPRRRVKAARREDAGGPSRAERRTGAQQAGLSELDEIIKMVALLPPAVRERLESHPQLLQV